VSALYRPALWLSACHLLVAALAAQCMNPTQVPNQTISSGTATYSDNNALRAIDVVINGSANVSFVAGNCIELKPGFSATAASSSTTFRAWLGTVQPALSITTTSPLPNGTTGVSYSATLAASGGTPGYTWALVSGALPNGLTLSANGTISGTPTITGTFSFTVRTIDSASGTVTKPLALTVVSGSGTSQTLRLEYIRVGGRVIAIEYQP
jgi:hypothetical protein